MKTSISHPIKRSGILALAILASTLQLWSCDQGVQVAGGSDETHSSVVDIQGRVLTKDSRPYANVIVRLRRLALLDTTDSDGRFRFQRDSLPVAARVASAVDTLDYLRDGQTILSAVVPSWITTLPDVMLVQRDLSGILAGQLGDVARVICVLGFPDSTSQQIDLELVARSRRYSGFAYFRYTGGVDSFTLWVKALDDSGRMIGRSALLRFSSRAGDIALPEFDATNAVPSVRLLVETSSNTVVSSVYPSADTANWRDSVNASRKETIHLHALVTDSFRRAARVEWNFGKGWVQASPSTPIPATACPTCYRDTSSSGVASPQIRILYHFDTTVAVPTEASGTWMPRVRVADKEGNVSEDTLRVRIVRSPPFASVWLTSSGNVLPGANLAVSMDDSDSFGGKIVSRRLFVGRYELEHLISSTYCLQLVLPDSGWWGRVYDKNLPCSESENVVIARFRAVSPGIPVSGADTTLTLPAGSTGTFQVLYEVVDDDSNATVIRSGTVVAHPPAPRIDSIRARPDSMDIHWSVAATIVEQTPETAESWRVRVSWLGSNDTSSLLLGKTTRTARVPRPEGAYAARIRIRQIIRTVDGFEADTTLDSLPAPILDFEGADFDPSRLQGAGFGYPRMSSLRAAKGAFLTGSVARVDWAVGDSFSISAAGAYFRLLPPLTPTKLHLDIANRSSLPIRLILIAPTLANYGGMLERRANLGWDVPAGFQGHLALALDSTDWQVGESASDTLLVKRKDVYASAEGLGLRVMTENDTTVRTGILEVDNIRWE